jgi:MFS family permease
LQTLYPIAALLLSVFLLISGNSLIGIVAPIRAHLDGFGDLSIGLLGSAYFTGMLLGTLQTPAIVRQVGHIRAFAAFVASAIVAVDIMPVFAGPAEWLVARALIGFAFAGIYAVFESWINAKANNRNRGSLYGVYQIVNFAAAATGQLMLRGLDPDGFVVFTVGSALFALAIVPLATTRADAPDLPRAVSLKLSWLIGLSPVSVAAALVAGAANGATFALAPVYALQSGVKPLAVPLFTAAIIVGSACGVYPIGRLSDRIDRRLIMAFVMAAGVTVELALILWRPLGAPLAALGFLVGLTTYSVYTLAVSLANDGAKTHDMVRVAAGLLFVYCLGAIVAPASASMAMRNFGASALFAQNALLHAGLALFAVWSLYGDRGAKAESRSILP